MLDRCPSAILRNSVLRQYQRKGPRSKSILPDFLVQTIPEERADTVQRSNIVPLRQAERTIALLGRFSFLSETDRHIGKKTQSKWQKATSSAVPPLNWSHWWRSTVAKLWRFRFWYSCHMSIKLPREHRLVTCWSCCNATSSSTVEDKIRIRFTLLIRYAQPRAYKFWYSVSVAYGRTCWRTWLRTFLSPMPFREIFLQPYNSTSFFVQHDGVIVGPFDSHNIMDTIKSLPPIKNAPKPRGVKMPYFMPLQLQLASTGI